MFLWCNIENYLQDWHYEKKYNAKLEMCQYDTDAPAQSHPHLKMCWSCMMDTSRMFANLLLIGQGSTCCVICSPTTLQSHPSAAWYWLLFSNESEIQPGMPALHETESWTPDNQMTFALLLLRHIWKDWMQIIWYQPSRNLTSFLLINM